MTSFQQLKQKRSDRHVPLAHRPNGLDPRAVDVDAVNVSTQESDNIAGPSRHPSHPIETGEPLPLTPPPTSGRSTSSREDEIYQMASRGVRIEQRVGRGRGVFANKAFKPGEVIYPITSRPPAAVLSTSNLTSHCSACFLSARDAAILQGKEEEPLKRCSACRVTHYCSTTCSRDDWTHHKPECSAFQLLRKRHKEKFAGTKAGSLDFLPHESVRALGRLLWMKKREEVGEECKAWEEYSLLQSNIDPEADKLAKLRQQLYRLAYYIGLSTPHLLETGSEMGLALLMKEYGIDQNPELELMKLWSRYQINAFTLDSPDLDALGVIVAPALAMANHSCEPNAVVVFPKGKGLGQITAIRPIKPDEEVLVCYIDVASPYSLRQSELSERYGFICDCSVSQREKEEGWVDPRWCVLHPGCLQKGKARMSAFISWEQIPLKRVSAKRQVGFTEFAKGTPLASRCDACGQAFAIDESKLIDLLGKAKDLLEADERGDLDTASTNLTGTVSAARTVTSQLLALCPPSSHPLIPLNRLLIRLLTIHPPTSLSTLSIPLHHLTLALEGARTIYTTHHPTLAILLAQKARLLGIQFPLTEEELSSGRSSETVRSEIQRMQAALVAYREAVKACQGCFGLDGGIVGMGLRGEMKGLEREMGAMRIVTSA